MALRHQLIDAVVAMAIAAATAGVLKVVLSGAALAGGVLLGTAVYFSRNPWGAHDGAKYNERVDERYEQLTTELSGRV